MKRHLVYALGGGWKSWLRYVVKKGELMDRHSPALKGY
jgi:hypothetical protein